MDRSDTDLQSLERQQEQWRNEIQKFRVIAEVADKDAQIGHYRIIDEITDDMDRFSQKMEEVVEVSSAGKEKLKEELQRIKERIDQAIEAARMKIN